MPLQPPRPQPESFQVNRTIAADLEDASKQLGTAHGTIGEALWLLQRAQLLFKGAGKDQEALQLETRRQRLHALWQGLEEETHGIASEAVRVGRLPGT